MSIATFFSPIPRKPPTPTISPMILPFLSNNMSFTLPMVRIVRTEHVGAFELREHPLIGTLRRDEFRGVVQGGFWFRRRLLWGQIGLRQGAGNHQRTDSGRNHESFEHCRLLSTLYRNNSRAPARVPRFWNSGSR